MTTLDRQASHRWPVFLPDGRHFLFYAQGAPDTAGIHLRTLDAGAPTRLNAADTAGTYLPAEEVRDGGPGGADALREGGWLLWTRAGTLVLLCQIRRSISVANRFDLSLVLIIHEHSRYAASQCSIAQRPPGCADC